MTTMADAREARPTQTMEPFKGVKKLPLEEYFTSGHRTCQGCESALVMKMMVKAAGPAHHRARQHRLHVRREHDVLHHVVGRAVDAHPARLERFGGTGTAAGLKALMRKGKIKEEPINVIAFCGDGGGADMGLAAISATLTHPDYNLLILMYDNESYANTDIQFSGSTPYGAHTTFSPPGKLKRIMHTAGRRISPG